MSRPKLGRFKFEMREFVDIDYFESLPPEEQAYMRKFLGEYYDHRFDEAPIQKGKGMKKETYKRENDARYDVYNTAKRTGQLDYIAERPVSHTADVSTTEMDFEEVYKHYGYKDALQKITTTLLNAIDEGIVDEEVAFERYYLQRDKLRRIDDADKRTEASLRKRRYGK